MRINRMASKWGNKKAKSNQITIYYYPQQRQRQQQNVQQYKQQS